MLRGFSVALSLVTLTVLAVGCNNAPAPDVTETPANEPAVFAVGSPVDAFNVKDLTGPAAGDTLCYRCRYGNKPVITVFTREINDDLAQLVKQIDEQVAGHTEEKLSSFVVYLGDDPTAAEQQLIDLAKAHELETPLTVFENSDGPRTYSIQPEANVTVMMWVKGELKSNTTFDSTAAAVDHISETAPSILGA